MADSNANFGSRRPNRGGFKSKSAEPKASSGGDLLGWAIFIVLLIGLVILCWMGSFYIFGHPEQPFSYSILQRMKKLEPPQRFADTAAPKGEFLDATKLVARYNAMTPRELQKESDRLLRHYIRNYGQTQDLIPYITGRFNILDSYQLGPDDFISSGIVALAQDAENPQVLIEHIFPAEERMVPALHRSLLTGLDIPIQRTRDLTAVTNVEKLPDGRLKFTVIPIHYPSYAATTGPGSFTLDPPTALNVEGGLPVLSKDKIADADARYASYRRKVGLDPAAAETAANELIRVQPAVDLAGESPAVPAPVEATPPVPAPDTPAPVVAGVGEPEPEVRPAVPLGDTPLAAATPTPAPTVAPAVPLKPFAGGTPAPAPAVANTASGGWQTYAPGQMPRGRLVNVGESSTLADQPVTGERLYLQGDFVVTAAGQNRAVLRSGGGSTSTTRVIVEFPAGSPPPGEGTQVNRNQNRPFLITDVRKSADGQVNVYVREITSE